MKQRGMGFVAIAAVVMLLIGATASASEGVWVSDKGHRVHLDRGHHSMLGEGAVAIEMDDLADGETRVIGAGEKQVTASRRGEVVTISRGARGESSALDLTCTIGRDTCKIITFEDDPARVMVMIEKTRTCENGEGDCADVDVLALGGHADGHAIHEKSGEGMHVIKIRKSVECDDDGDCQDFEEVLSDGAGGNLSTVVIEAIGEGVDLSEHANVFVMKGDHVTLRCAEGDTTMRVEPEEAEDVFLCPKHSTPLEKSKAHPRVMRRKIKADRD